MNWEAAAAIGEILGAGAVLVTVAYLAVQVRQNMRIPAKWKGQFGASGRVVSEQEARARSEATLEWI